jgi:hypothetical protein
MASESRKVATSSDRFRPVPEPLASNQFRPVPYYVGGTGSGPGRLLAMREPVLGSTKAAGRARMTENRCGRCGQGKCGFQFEAVFLCDGCLNLIILEWAIRRDEFAELAK